MQAECPYCHTIFRLTTTQLEIADGMVRCGVCHEVFNALEKDSPSGAQADTQANSSTNDPAKQQTTSSTSNTLFEAQNKLIPDNFRIPDVYQSKSHITGIAWALLITLASASLVVEYMWFNRNQLLNDRTLKPWIVKMCDIADCELMAIRDTKQIEMKALNVYSHPNIKNALMVSVTMVNHATFAQPHPTVQIDFSDIRGKLIAARRFTPEEYFQLDMENLRPLEPEQSVSFGLEIQDPGKQAMTYELNFL